MRFEMTGEELSVETSAVSGTSFDSLDVPAKQTSAPPRVSGSLWGIHRLTSRWSAAVTARPSGQLPQRRQVTRASVPADHMMRSIEEHESDPKQLQHARQGFEDFNETLVRLAQIEEQIGVVGARVQGNTCGQLGHMSGSCLSKYKGKGKD